MLELSYAKNANLPVTFKEYKSSDESGWTTYNIGQHLFSISARLLGTTLGGMGGIVAGFAATATQAELDIFNTLASQSVEAQLLSLSVGIASQGTTVASQMAANIESGLKCRRQQPDADKTDWQTAYGRSFRSRHSPNLQPPASLVCLGSLLRHFD